MFYQILTELGKVREAIGLLERALHIDPSSKIIQQDLMRLQAKQKSDVAKERSLYKKMFQLNDPPSSASSNEKPKIKLTVSLLHTFHLFHYFICITDTTLTEVICLVYRCRGRL